MPTQNRNTRLVTLGYKAPSGPGDSATAIDGAAAAPYESLTRH
jgi:hypothetical protein